MTARPQITFDDTEVAFEARSVEDLRRAYWLYKALGSPWMATMGPKLLLAAVRMHLPVESIVRATIFRQFCGGESIDGCNGTIADLARFKIGTILDYSVEGKETEEDFDRTRDEILQIVEYAAGDPNIPFAVFKVTGLGCYGLLEKVQRGEQLSEDEETQWAGFRGRVETICEAGSLAAVPVLIDAEESWIQGAIDALVAEMMARFNRETVIVYNTIQMYRADRLDFLRASLAQARADGYRVGIKLVRGAYMEKERERAEAMGYPSPIHTDKDSSDVAFNEALKCLMAEIDRVGICCGSHNETSTDYLASLMADAGLSAGDERIYFSQLLGMSDHISYNLARLGYNVTKYVPYGPIREVVPYLVRRAEENTSIAGQTGRELALLIRELERRGES